MPLSSHVTAQQLSALRIELSVQRNLQGLTYDDLAQLSGVSRRALVGIEVGTSSGSVESWLQICNALGTTFARFLEVSLESHTLATVALEETPDARSGENPSPEVENLTH
jgi:putative transcriptional regulator